MNNQRIAAYCDCGNNWFCQMLPSLRIVAAAVMLSIGMATPSHAQGGGTQLWPGQPPKPSLEEGGVRWKVLEIKPSGYFWQVILVDPAILQKQGPQVLFLSAQSLYRIDILGYAYGSAGLPTAVRVGPTARDPAGYSVSLAVADCEAGWVGIPLWPNEQHYSSVKNLAPFISELLSEARSRNMFTGLLYPKIRIGLPYAPSIGAEYICR